MKIVLLGKSGMLGSAFLAKLHFCELVALGHSELDVTDYEKMERVFSNEKPDYVINCTAMAGVDDCEENQERARLVNGEAPGEMARICKNIGATLIHISTDYVFDGTHENGYAEYDKPHPLNYYGKSKLLGEENIQKFGEKFYIVRSCWLFGEGAKNFVAKIVETAESGKPVFLAEDLYGCPTYTPDLAAGVIENFIQNTLPYGIYHLTNEGAVSRLEFGKKLLEFAGLSPEIKMVKAAELNLKAIRPKFSILRSTKIQPLRFWEDALKVYVDLTRKK